MNPAPAPARTAVRGIERSAWRLSSGTVLLIVLLFGGTLLATELLQGWFAYDEGMLGQSAERVLRGEVPHRDFDEIYTGLLTYLHAAVFAVFGPGLVILRLTLFLAAMSWLWTMYRILLRFAPPAGAGLVALVAFVWGVPNYPAAMPSWYILFAATFGALALIRWHETTERRWLVLAGVAGGVAFLFKLSGIFFFLGGGLALMVVDEARAPGENGEPAPPARGTPEWGSTAALLAMVMALGWVVGRGGDREVLRHVLPTAVLALAIAAKTWTPRFGPPAARWRTLGQRLLPLALGGIVPIAAFFAFYAAVGGLPAMLEGVFVTPFRRLEFAAMRPPAVASLAFSVPLMLLLWSPSNRGTRRLVLPVLAALLFVAVIVLAGTDSRFYQVGWFSAWGLLFFVAIDGARQVLATGGDETDRVRRAASVTLACIAVAMSLIEYPYAVPLYMLYAFPLTLIAATAAVRVDGRTSAQMQLVVAGFLLAFGLLRVVPGTVFTLGLHFSEDGIFAPLELPRGGLRIEPHEAVAYEHLIPIVKELADGRAIWAGPDSPEVYFLTGLPNHTRSLFDFLDTDAMTADLFLRRLDSLGVALVVVKMQPPFSARLTRATVDALRRAYPQERVVSGFLVLWRGP